MRCKRYEKEKYRYTLLVLLMPIATIAACASTRTHESAGEYVDDKSKRVFNE